jgi:hypothetical protein
MLENLTSKNLKVCMIVNLYKIKFMMKEQKPPTKKYINRASISQVANSESH